VTIVVADDSPLVLRMLTVLLEDQGHDVVGACDGDEALARIRQVSPALVVIDASMPKRSGYEVCQELRADRTLTRQPYVIMLTAGGQTAERERAERTGVDEFMTKPFNHAKLRERVTMALGAPRTAGTPFING
jgi:DNA-binding response OmpR family regulator